MLFRRGLHASFVFSMAAYVLALPFQINCAATHWCMCGHVENLSRSEWQRHADCTWLVLLPLALIGTLFIRGQKYRFYLWCFVGVLITPFLGNLAVIPALLALARLYEVSWQGSDAQQDKDRRTGV